MNSFVLVQSEAVIGIVSEYPDDFDSDCKHEQEHLPSFLPGWIGLRI